MISLGSFPVIDEYYRNIIIDKRGLPTTLKEDYGIIINPAAERCKATETNAAEWETFRLF
jgi:hypothetical protein